MVEFEVPEPDYDRYTNRQLATVPLAVLAVALVVITGWYVATGAPVSPGIEFTGGTEVQLETSASQQELRTAFEFEVASVQPVAGSNEYIIETQETDTEAVQAQVSEVGEVISIQTTSATFGEGVQRQALLGVAGAFVGMSVLVFALFRTFVPSIAVVLSAFSDIMIPVALMNVFTALPLLPDIELSLGTVAALLMLIGYSVDSDILLNNHILRRRGTFYESTYRAMQTGVTMTVTSIAAMTVMYIVSSLFGIPLLPEIAVVLVFGLTADLMNTYMMNLSLLRYYKFEGINA